MEVHLKYGQGAQSVYLPGEIACETLMPNGLSPLADPTAAVLDALRHPIGTPPLRQIVRAGERVAVLVNDITRLVHSEVFLPLLLDELNAAGVPDRDIFVVFALGIHRRQTVEEQHRIVGEEVAQRIALYDHDCYHEQNLIHIGRTSRGNEVWINRKVHEADRVILTGEIIHHLIAGYSGGRKSLVPGVAGEGTTTFNHRFILDPRCRSGVLDGNPVHEDLMEACRMFDPDFLLNVVLNPRGQLVRVVAGHYEHAHRVGCQTVDRIYRVAIEKPYDLILASAGGFPFDIDLRQAHKGMENAARALRAGGVLVYFAECRDGAGHQAFEEWVGKLSSSAEMERDLRSKFVVGGHKAYWVVRLGENARIYLFSRLPDEFVRRCHLHPASAPQAVIDAELAHLRPGGRVAHIPYAGLTLPDVVSEPVAAGG
jgi:nickel-dependent lactate racemase